MRIGLFMDNHFLTEFDINPFVYSLVFLFGFAYFAEQLTQQNFPRRFLNSILELQFKHNLGLLLYEICFVLLFPILWFAIVEQDKQQ